MLAVFPDRYIRTVAYNTLVLLSGFVPSLHKHKVPLLSGSFLVAWIVGAWVNPRPQQVWVDSRLFLCSCVQSCLKGIKRIK